MSRSSMKSWLLGGLLLAVAATAASTTPAALAAGPRDGLEQVSRERVNDRLLQIDFETPAIDGGTGIRVLLPPGYRDAKRDYPVLYLLHGAGYDETSWTEIGDAQEIVGDRKLIVVMPRGGGNGYYTNWFNGGDFGAPAYERAHIRQILPWVDAHFRTRAERGGRATAGFSMGGFGAMSYAARHPDLFSATFSFSGAVDTNYPLFEPIGEASSVGDGGRPGDIWGLRAAQELRWRARNPWDLASNLRGMTVQLRTGNGQKGGPFGGPAFDPIEFGVHEMAVSMNARLDSLGIDHLLEDYGPGGHRFPYYSRDLRRSLPAMMRNFANRPADPRRFSYRAAESRFRVYGYNVRMRRDALEFARLSGKTSARRFTVSGSGGAVVRTPGSFKPKTRYTVKLTGDRVRPRTKRIRSTGAGRLLIPVPLGPSNRFQQYTPQARATGTKAFETRVAVRRR